jgi:hypothetical protein
MKFRRSSRYRPEEVQVLVEQYAELREKKGTGTAGGVRLLCTLADLDRAIRAVPLNKRRKMLPPLVIHGMLGLTVREAAALLGERKSTVEDRYLAGIAWITNYLNGET